MKRRESATSRRLPCVPGARVALLYLAFFWRVWDEPWLIGKGIGRWTRCAHCWIAIGTCFNGENGRRFQLDGATRPEKSTFLAVVEWALSKRVALREHLSEEGGQAASTLIVGQ